MKVVYIAGPYRAPTAWGIAQNVRAAEEVGLECALLGAMPLIPHTISAHMHGELDEQFWIEGTLELLRRCDAVVLVPGWTGSEGTRGEIAEATRLALPVLRPSELEAWLDGERG